MKFPLKECLIPTSWLNNEILESSKAQTIDFHVKPWSTVPKLTNSSFLISFHFLHCIQCLSSLANINRSFAQGSVLDNINNHYETSSMFKINNQIGLHCFSYKFQTFSWQRASLWKVQVKKLQLNNQIPSGDSTTRVPVLKPAGKQTQMTVLPGQGSEPALF